MGKSEKSAPTASCCQGVEPKCGCATSSRSTEEGTKEPCGCAEATTGASPGTMPWSDGSVRTPLGAVPRVKTALTARDHFGTVKVRLNIGRMSYRVDPGLCAVGEPDTTSPVLVSANYKLSFDTLRSVLGGRSAWILVLDTKGVNVWCAAGKGTFGTDELVRRVESCRLSQLVSHRKLIVPQLGSPGVCAHEVQKRCGFRVSYGPVRAADLPAFLEAGLRATPGMRRVQFNLWDRVVLVPVELSLGAAKALGVASALALLGGVGLSGYSMESIFAVGLPSAASVVVTFALASFLGAALLPWLPGRAFSLKGAALGLALYAGLAAIGLVGPRWLHLAAWALAIPAISSFVVMNFTGATTFTSQSGVLREMRIAVPLQIGAGVLALALWLVGLFVPGKVLPS